MDASRTALGDRRDAKRVPRSTITTPVDGLLGSWTLPPAVRALPLALDGAIGRGPLVLGFTALVSSVIVFQFLEAREVYGGGDSASPERRTNCPSCGARIPADAEAWEYCGDPVDR